MAISVITVTFNALAALKDTVDSVRAVDSEVDEFIVIDGASTDGTGSYLQSEAGVSQWISEPDRGIYDAMNKGWALAKQDNHILFLGAGDKILKLPSKRELEPAVCVFGNVDLEQRGTFSSTADLRMLLGNTLHHQALLVPKVLIPSRPFDDRFKTYADYDLSLRLRKRGVRFRKSHQFRSYAAAGGVSFHLNQNEMSTVVEHNYGWIAGRFSKAYLFYQRRKS